MVYLRLYSQDKMNWIMAGLVFLWLLVMLIFYRMIKPEDRKKQLIMRLLCRVPAFICIFHLVFFGFKGRTMLSILSYGGFYLSAIIIALLPTFEKIKRKMVIHVVMTVLAFVGCAFTVVYPAITNCGTRNYTHMSYMNSFEAMVENMRQYDTLLDWKKIDLEKIERDIKPLVVEAEEKRDDALFIAAMCKYTYHFFDGHTWVNASDKMQREAENLLAGNDYGFSMIRLADGETIATLVESGCEANQNGIVEGTKIIRWNGKDIDDALDKVECIYTKEYGRWPVKENEDMFRPIFLAGKGGDQIEVTYMTSNHVEKTVKLAKLGSYRERLEKACEVLLAKDKLKEQKNYDTKMLSDTFGYMRISEEEYSFASDMMAYISGSNGAVRDMFDRKIADLKKKGMKKLVIDVRNNTGGYSVIPLELASLFTKKNIYINSMAHIQGNTKKLIRDEYVKGNGKYADMDVVVLTNSRCVSAGDYLVYCMGKCENVKVVGITTSTGSSQPIGGNCVMTNGICDIRYPQNWMLDGKGERFIDTNEERINRVPLDEKIPLTVQGVQEMFHDIDYELKYIVEKYS